MPLDPDSVGAAAGHRMKGPISDDAVRAMYVGGRADSTARRFARFWGVVFASGIAPRRWVRLEVRGRRTGRVMRIPVGLADVDDRWYAVSMLGECNWVRNVRAADGHAVLRRGVGTPIRMVEVSVEERSPMLRRYLEVAPGGRPHIPATAASSDAELSALAARYPVFLLHDDDGRHFRPSRSWFPFALLALIGLARLIASLPPQAGG